MTKVFIEHGKMKNHNFRICNADTDSIAFCKDDLTLISEEERKSLVKEINDISPEFMQWADDGYYKFLICIKSKNYVLQTFDGKIKIKGSALKDQKKEPALLEFLREIINSILNEKYNYSEIYNQYVHEILNLKDIKRWATKKTITEKVLNGTRTNETKVMDALKGTEFSEGDKVYVYFDTEKNLKLVSNYHNDHNVQHMLKRLYDTSVILTGKKKEDSGIIPKGTFVNYSLVKEFKTLVSEKGGTPLDLSKVTQR